MSKKVEIAGATSRIRRFFLGGGKLRNGLLALGFGLILTAIAWPPSDATVGSASTAGSQPLDLPAPSGVPEDATPSRISQTVTAAVEKIASINDASITADATSAPVVPDAEWTTLTVRNGDNLAAVFNRAGLSARDVHEVVNTDERTDDLTRIYPGDELELLVDSEGSLQGLRYEMNETEILHLARNGDAGYESRIETITLERRIVEAEGRISSSLFNAAIDAGLDHGLTMELAAIFAWDIDFALDIRRNDRFVVIFEELYRDGEKVRNGNILAAEFINRGDRFRALRFETAEGESNYYTPDGRSMRKAFLRTPTDFTRVSSDFNPNRVHPVYGTKRPHRGTDYAAPPGTPIKAAGDGKIIERGVKGGYGNTVVLQHGTRYTTLYAHMRSFANGHSVGDRVKQGEIIGYVGSTGVSTGPHLHYEFRVDGVHRNPRTVDLPDAEPIAERYRADFERGTARWVARLDAIGSTQLAQAGD